MLLTVAQAFILEVLLIQSPSGRLWNHTDSRVVPPPEFPIMHSSQRQSG